MPLYRGRDGADRALRADEPALLRVSAARAGRAIVVAPSAAVAVDVCESKADCTRTIFSSDEGLGAVVDARWCEHSDDHALVLCERALLLVDLGGGGVSGVSGGGVSSGVSGGGRAFFASAPARVVERIPLPEGLRPAAICALPAHSGGWDAFAAALLTRDGAVYTLCPLVAPGSLLPRAAWEQLLCEEVGEAARRRVPARAGTAGLPVPINGADLRARWLRENFCDDESGDRLDAAGALGVDVDVAADAGRKLVRYAPRSAPDALFAPGAWATCLQGPLRETPRDDGAVTGGAATGPAEWVDVLARAVSFSVAAAPAAPAAPAALAAPALAVQLPVVSLLCSDGRLKTLLADRPFAPSWTRRSAAIIRAGEREHVNEAVGVVMPRIDAREQCLDFVRMRDEDAPGGRSFLVVEAIALPLRRPSAAASPPARPAFVPCGIGAPADVVLVSSTEGVFEVTQFWQQPLGGGDVDERSRDPAVRLFPAAELGHAAGPVSWAPGDGGLGALLSVAVSDGLAPTPSRLCVRDISLSGRGQFLRPPFMGSGSGGAGAHGSAGDVGSVAVLDTGGGGGQPETRLHSLRQRLANSLVRVQEAATAAHRDDERRSAALDAAAAPPGGAPVAGGADGAGARDEDEDEVTAKREQKLADESRAREMARVEEVLRRAKQHHAEQAVLAAFARDLQAEAEEWLDRGWRDTNTDARLGQSLRFVEGFRERRARAAGAQAALATRAERIFRVVGCAAAGARDAAGALLAEDLAKLRAAARQRSGAIAAGGGTAGGEARPAEVARADLDRALRLSALWARDLASDAEAELPRALRSLRAALEFSAAADLRSLREGLRDGAHESERHGRRGRGDEGVAGALAGARREVERLLDAATRAARGTDEALARELEQVRERRHRILGPVGSTSQSHAR